jgi:hypothetical protein
MQVKIINADQAGMPNDMIANCEILLAKRFKKLGSIEPEIDILYSEKDPLREKEPWGEDAYAIYFKTAKITPHEERSPEKATLVEIELVF